MPSSPAFRTAILALSAGLAALALALAVLAQPLNERCYNCPAPTYPAYTPFPTYGAVPNAIACASGVRLTRYQIDKTINRSLTGAPGSEPLSLFELPGDGGTTGSEDGGLELRCDAVLGRDLYQIPFYGSGKQGSVLLVKQDGTCGAYTRWISSDTSTPRAGSCILCPASGDGDTTWDGPDYIAPSAHFCNEGNDDYDYPYYPCAITDGGGAAGAGAERAAGGGGGGLGGCGTGYYAGGTGGGGDYVQK